MVQLSIIVPALNEEALIGETLASIERALTALEITTASLDGKVTEVEILLVDNGSRDSTRTIAGAFPRATVVDCPQRGAARARNHGARLSQGEILVFLDADTLLPEGVLDLVLSYCRAGTVTAGIAPYCARDGGIRANIWWWFWNHVRRLPLPHAKAMPAFMFCTRAVFDELGPFDERVAIGEEWPILARLYARTPAAMAYLWTIPIPTSSRRMELKRFGYLRLFCKYVWAVLVFRGRVNYDDTIRNSLSKPASSP